MVGGRLEMVADLLVIFNRMTRLDRDDPMREAGEQNFLNYLLQEQSRYTVPIGVEALSPPAVEPAAASTQHPTQEPQPGPSGVRPLNHSLGLQIPRLGHARLLSLGILVPKAGHVRPLNRIMGLHWPYRCPGWATSGP